MMQVSVVYDFFFLKENNYRNSFTVFRVLEMEINTT